MSWLADAAPALLGHLLSFELDGSPPGLLEAYSGDAFGRFLHTLAVTPRPVNGPILEIGANPTCFPSSFGPSFRRRSSSDRASSTTTSSRPGSETPDVGSDFFDLYQVGTGVHGRHNREFSLAEVRPLLERDGFEIVGAETRDRFDYDEVPIEAVEYSAPPAILPFEKGDLLRWIARAGGTTADRGDDIYVVARRPASHPPSDTSTGGSPDVP